MSNDPVREVRSLLRSQLGDAALAGAVEDGGLPKKVPWGPHLFQPKRKTAWHCLTDYPEDGSWLDRMRAGLDLVPGLSVGVVAPVGILKHPPIVEALDELDAVVLPYSVEEHGVSAPNDSIRRRIGDVIYENRFTLPHESAVLLYERGLTRALGSQDSYEKGALLELLVALLLSQVDGFEVTDVNLSTANQEIDVNVVNRTSRGPLGRGQFVLVEAKNWGKPVPRKEYDAFAKKLRSRRGMAKLGIMVTTNTFEKGVFVEALRDSEKDDLILLLDKKSFPQVWRAHKSATLGLENAVKRAAFDYQL